MDNEVGNKVINSPSSIISFTEAFHNSVNSEISSDDTSENPCQCVEKCIGTSDSLIETAVGSSLLVSV
jgi:hypothetical protein